MCNKEQDYYRTSRDEEELLIEQIKQLQEEYNRAAKPFIDRLVELRGLRPMQPMLITYEQAQRLGLVGDKPWGER